MTVSPPKSLSKEAREQAEVQIEEALQRQHGEDAEGYAERTVQLPRGTASYVEGDFAAEEVADSIFESIPEAKWIAVVDANDTGDDGAGEVYKREGGETLCVDTFVGYGGARGNDVCGMIDDEYGIPSYCSFEA